jgi:hypothetical protein
MWRTLYFNEGFEQATKNVLASGLGQIDHGKGLIVPTTSAMAYDTNWLFSGYTTSLRDCRLWHSIMFNHYNLVPEFCRLRCYKVVIKVRNFREAFQMHGLLDSAGCINAKVTGLHGKVGVDERYFSSGLFNAFVYCDGLEDALRKYQEVRSLVDEHLEDGKNIAVIIKRSCTEFERKFGATDQDFWQSMSQNDLALQRRLEDMYAPEWSSAVQPDWLKNKIIFRWIRWANTHDDKTWIEFYPGNVDDITMKPVTYQHLVKEMKENGTSKD